MLLIFALFVCLFCPQQEANSTPAGTDMVSPQSEDEEDIPALEMVTKKRKIETIENETKGGEKVEEVINYQRKDTRRSWAVVTATFLLIFIETGVVTTLGVLLPDIREQFATKTWVVGFAIALVPGFGSVVCEYKQIKAFQVSLRAKTIWK